MIFIIYENIILMTALTSGQRKNYRNNYVIFMLKVSRDIMENKNTKTFTIHTSLFWLKLQMMKF